MDVFNHGLWSYIAFHNKSKIERISAVAFGVLPDLIPFAPATLYLLINRISFNPDLYNARASWMFQWAYVSYNYTHSLVVFAIAFLVVYAIRRKPLWPMLAWGLHVAMDIPTHPNFYQTPFLYPISNYKFYGGVSWGHPVFMAVNYGLVILSFILIYAKARKKQVS